MGKKEIFYILKLLVYYIAYQTLFTVVSMIAVGINSFVSGNVDVDAITKGLSDNSDAMASLLGDNIAWAISLGLFMSSLAMLWHLIHFGYFKIGKSPLQQVKNGVMVLSILIVFSSMFAFNIIAQWFDLPDNLSGQMKDLSDNCIGVLSIAVLAPLLEEVLFRGAIQGYLMRRMKSPWLAIIIASLIFGIIHMNPIQIFYATMLGVVFGWIYYRTGSLVPVIIGHVMNNSLAAISLIFAVEGEQEMELGMSNEIIIVVVAIVVSITLALILNKKQPAVPQPWHAAGEETEEPEENECVKSDNQI